jgi:phosphoenolpyruvate-protein kinase (PTS system EI component)
MRLPALVGLAVATERIADGQMIVVNGTTSTVNLKTAAVNKTPPKPNASGL